MANKIGQWPSMASAWTMVIDNWVTVARAGRLGHQDRSISTNVVVEEDANLQAGVQPSTSITISIPNGK